MTGHSDQPLLVYSRRNSLQLYFVYLCLGLVWVQDESEAMKSVILIDVEEEFKECNFKANASFKSYFNWVFCLFVC